jgi:hypothetical protein
MPPNRWVAKKYSFRSESILIILIRSERHASGFGKLAPSAPFCFEAY